MPRALIADDEPLMRSLLKERLSQVWPELSWLEDAEDGPTALARIEGLKPDLAFLDIRMPGMTGLEVARALTTRTRVVIVTAHDNHAIEAFEANAVDYLLKPVDLPRLARVVGKLREQLSQDPHEELDRLREALRTLSATNAASATSAGAAFPDTATPSTSPAAAQPALDWLQVAVGQQIRLVHLEDVIYFESDTKYTRVVADDCDGLVRLPLKEILDAARPELFLQTHRSVVVNRRYIRSIHRIDDRVEIELKGRPERLRVSAANHGLFRAM